MNQAKNGDTVKVHYTGRLENGTPLGTSKSGQPVEVEIGSGRLIPGLENGIIDMRIGETKTITLPPEQAYGPRWENLIVDLKKSDFPDDIAPAIGKEIQVQQEDGNLIDAVITHVDADTVTLDANHPLAGETLVLEVELVAIT